MSEPKDSNEVRCVFNDQDWKLEVVVTQTGTVITAHNMATFDTFETTNPIPGKTLHSGEIFCALRNEDGYYFRHKPEGDSFSLTICKDDKFRPLKEVVMLQKKELNDLDVLKKRMEKLESKVKEQEKTIAVLTEYVKRKLDEEEKEEKDRKERAILVQELFGADEKQIEELQNWISFDIAKVKLLYQASKDGFSSATFHSKCDNQGATLTVIELNDGHIFGGYSPVAWDQSGGSKYAAGAFLFSLTDGKGRQPVRIDQYQNPGYAIYCGNTFGPIFGGGNDLRVHLDALSSSYSNLGHTYLPPFSYAYNSSQAQNFLAGSYNNWSFKDVRVLQIP